MPRVSTENPSDFNKNNAEQKRTQISIFILKLYSNHPAIIAWVSVKRVEVVERS